MGHVVGIEKAAKKRVSHGGYRPLERRVKGLEDRMHVVETTTQQIKADTASILSAVSVGRGFVGFIKKHGPRLMAAGTGAAVTAGFLNPNIAAFLNALFS